MPSTGFPIAVVFLVFRRPALTQRVFERLRALRPARLFVVADGPRAGNPAEAEQCRAVRRIVDEGIDWPCTVVRDYAPENLGCARRVSSGLNGVFSQVQEAIVLEDDCLPEPSFFPFCAELLDRYRDDERVAQIAGCSFQDPMVERSSGYFFSRYPHSWGWATWRRSWRHYDHAMTGWPTADDQMRLESSIENPVERRMWTQCFDATAAGRIDSWAYRWTLSVWRRNALSALPYANLISNIGFGGDATHTRRAGIAAERPLAPVSFPLIHPREIVRDAAADEHTSRLLFRPESLFVRATRRIGRMFRT